SKAPWYFLSLQELLLHMNPALAGVIVPTVFLILLAAVPYFDTSREGQGSWFATVNSVKITLWSTLVGVVGTFVLILYDSGKHALLWEGRLRVLPGNRALKPDHIGLGIFGSDWKFKFGHWPTGVERPDWLPHSGFIFAIWDVVFSRNLRAIQTEW